MSSTFFTASPEWRWFIVAYFFLGGLAGGSYFLATLMDRFGTERDRPLVRLGYLIAFPIVCLCGLVLTVDLGRPERFWHMLVQSQTFRPMLKTYSPMSSGAWVLLLFSGCAFLSFGATLAERGAGRIGQSSGSWLRQHRSGGWSPASGRSWASTWPATRACCSPSPTGPSGR